MDAEHRATQEDEAIGRIEGVADRMEQVAERIEEAIKSVGPSLAGDDPTKQVIPGADEDKDRDAESTSRLRA